MRAFLLRYFRPFAGVCRARFDGTGCQFLITTFRRPFVVRTWSGASAAQQVEERVAFVAKLLQDALAAARSVVVP
jgi:hypothetical protein